MSLSKSSWSKLAAVFLALVLALGVTGDAFARAGFGGSFGSRGGRTFSAPPSTAISPNTSSINRSVTAPTPGFGQPGFAAPGGFGFGRGFLGGLVGAGLIGLLFGHGLFGGIGGGLSLIGLLIQVGLIVLLVRFAMNFFRGRQPAFPGMGFTGAGPLQGGAGPAPASPPRGAPLTITPEDYNAFEQRLTEVQAAYSAEDLSALRRLTSPEMASYFAEELAATARKGLVNRLADVKLLSGELSEAWSEATGDYATVAMRFALTDTMVDRASGRIVSGNPSEVQQVTEVWTFQRPRGASSADWWLSAIQQA